LPGAGRLAAPRASGSARADAPSTAFAARAAFARFSATRASPLASGPVASGRDPAGSTGEDIVGLLGALTGGEGEQEQTGKRDGGKGSEEHGRTLGRRGRHSSTLGRRSATIERAVFATRRLQGATSP